MSTDVLAWGIILIPFVLTAVILLLLFYPRYLTFPDVIFIAFPVSQAATCYVIFFAVGLTIGTIKPFVLISFAFITFGLTLILLYKKGNIIRSEIGNSEGTKASDVVLWVIAIAAAIWFYYLYLVHAPVPVYDGNSAIPDPLTTVELTPFLHSGLDGQLTGYKTQGAAWSDLPFHMALINTFRFGINSYEFSPMRVMSFLFSGTEMGIPIFPDFHAALLCLAGFNLREAIVIPSTLMSTSLVGLLYLFGRRFCSSRSITDISGIFGGLFTTLMVIFAGGSGILSFLAGILTAYQKDENLTETATKLLIETDFVQSFGKDGREIHWLSLIYHLMLPQRFPTYAYPMFVSFVIVMYVAIESYDRFWVATKKKSEGNPAHESIAKSLIIWRQGIKRLFCCAGVIGGLTPLLQSHTFLSICLISGFFVLVASKKWYQDYFHLFHWIGLLVPLFVIGYLQVASVLIRPLAFQDFGNFTFKMIWEETDNIGYYIGGFFRYWFYSLGLFVFVYFYSLSNLFDSPIRLKFYLASLFLFLFGNFITVNPWNKDNVKLFYCWHVIASASIAYSFVRLWPHNYLPPIHQYVPKPQPKSQTAETEPKPAQEPKFDRELAFDEVVFTSFRRSIIITTFIVLIATGLLAVFREPHLNYDLINKDELAMGAWVKDNTPYDARFMTSDAHVQAISTLAGRAQHNSFVGWMWTQGHDYSSRVEKLAHVYSCKNTTEVLEVLTELDTHYIYVDPKFVQTWQNGLNAYLEDYKTTLEIEAEADDYDEDEFSEANIEALFKRQEKEELLAQIQDKVEARRQEMLSGGALGCIKDNIQLVYRAGDYLLYKFTAPPKQ